MEVELLKCPTQEDWELVKRATLETVGKRPKNPPTLEWERSILEARHSPIRLLQFVFELRDIPYWVSVHCARHVHSVPFVRSQRNDRQSDYDRNAARQDAPVNMMWAMNAEELMTICAKRLCNQSAEETRSIVREMATLVIANCPEFDGLLKPQCEWQGGVCHEMNPCGRVGRS